MSRMSIGISMAITIHSLFLNLDVITSPHLSIRIEGITGVVLLLHGDYISLTCNIAIIIHFHLLIRKYRLSLNS